MICAECTVTFTPDRFHDACNECGDELHRQYERMEDFKERELTLAVLSARITFGVMPRWRRAWVIG